MHEKPNPNPNPNPQVNTREPSFLENPRTPRALTRSVARLRLWSSAALARAATAAAKAAATAMPPPPVEVHLASTVGPAELLDALQQARHARVLRVHQLLHHLPFLAAEDARPARLGKPSATELVHS